MVNIGEKILDFTADVYIAGKFKKINFSEFRGRWLVLFFYPLDFTFICPTEIRAFARKQKEFENLNAMVIGASTDSLHSHKAWFERDLQEVNYPVIADTNHKVSKIFDVLKIDEGITYRGTFIIDQDGILRYKVVSDLSVGRNVEETLRVLQALQTGELCPVEWKPGAQTLGKA